MTKQESGGIEIIDEGTDAEEVQPCCGTGGGCCGAKIYGNVKE